MAGEQGLAAVDRRVVAAHPVESNRAMLIRRWRAACGTRELRQRDLVDEPDCPQAKGDDFNGLSALRKRIEPLVHRMEAFDEAHRPTRVDRAGRRIEAQLEALFGVAEIDKPGETVALRRHALARERGGGLGRELLPDLMHRLEIVIGAALER